MQIKDNDKGVTLIELIIVIGLLVVVLAVLYNIFMVSQKSFQIGIDKSIVQQDARVCSNKITDELKLAKTVSLTEPTGEYYRISLKPNGTTVYKSVIITKYSEGVAAEQEFGSYIQSITFTTKTTNSKVVQFDMVVTTGKQTIPINSSVQLINTTADLTTSSSQVFYTKY